MRILSPAVILLSGALLALGAPAHASRLGNLSTRMQVLDGDNVAIAGFVIDGTTNKTVVITGKGPSLTAYGINNPLPDPTMTVVRMSDQAAIAVNDNWVDAPNASQISASGFAPANGLESAVMMSLAPGAYTAVVSGVNHGVGVGLVEVYEVNQPQTILSNISTRARVGTGSDVMIGGFVVQGSGPQKVIVLAKGPSLAQFGVSGTLPDPTMTLVRADGTYVANNDNWPAFELADDLRFSGLAPTNTRESAVLVTLDPGAYTAIVSGAGEANTGVALVEVYAWDGVGRLSQPNTSSVHTGFNGVTYAYHLPRNPSGLYGSGFLQQGPHPLTPSELTVEWALSKVPGDFDFYKKAPALGPAGQVVCGGINGANGATYYWSESGSFYECKVDSASAWYLNVRYLNNCPPGVRCPVSYFHSES